MFEVFFHSNELRRIRRYIDLRAGVIYINRAADPMTGITVKLY